MDNFKIMKLDLDQDLEEEIIGIYREGSDVFINKILKKDLIKWNIIENKLLENNQVSYFNIVKLTSTDNYYTLIGYKVDENYHKLTIFEIQNNQLSEVIKNIYFSYMDIYHLKNVDAIMIWLYEHDDKKYRKVIYRLSDKKLKIALDLYPRYQNIYERELYPAYINQIGGEKWGYIDRTGKFLIEAKYDEAYDFQKNGLAIVTVNNLSGLIDKGGNERLKPKYDTINEFSCGLAVVIDNEGFKILNEQGQLVTKKPYSYINSYQNNRVLFYQSNQNGTMFYGYLDLEGNEIIPPIYLNGTDFMYNKAVVKTRDLNYDLIDTFGNVLHTYSYSYVGNIGNGYLAFKKTDQGKYGYIEESGRILLPTIYTEAQPFINNRAIVGIEDFKYGIIDQKGKFIIKPEFRDIYYLKNKRYAVGIAKNMDKPYLGSFYALVDENGNFLTNFDFNSISKFQGEIAVASDEEKVFFLNYNGEVLNNFPILFGFGTMEDVGRVIKANIDYNLNYLLPNGLIIYQPNDVIKINEQVDVNIKKYNPNVNYIVYYPHISHITEQLNLKLMEKSQVKIINTNTHLEYSYYGNFKVKFYKDNLLSILFEGYNYPFGAAHGMPYQSYCHIDLEKSMCYELSDLFKSNINYVNVLSAILDKQIKEDGQYEYLFEDAFKGINPNQPFYVDESHLYLYFAPYEIAPYAVGFPTFKIQFTDIRDIIDDKSDFWLSFHK